MIFVEWQVRNMITIVERSAAIVPSRLTDKDLDGCIFRCASISCTDDCMIVTHSLRDGLLQKKILSAIARKGGGRPLPNFFTLFSPHFPLYFDISRSPRPVRQNLYSRSLNEGLHIIFEGLQVQNISNIRFNPAHLLFVKYHQINKYNK